MSIAPFPPARPLGEGRSVTIDEAAQLLGVCRRTVYNWIKAGRLATRRTLGGSQRVLADSLQRLVFETSRRPDSGAHS